MNTFYLRYGTGHLHSVLLQVIRDKEKELRRNIENHSKTVCFQRTNSIYTENPEKSLELADLICKYSKVVDMSPGNLDSSL